MRHVRICIGSSCSICEGVKGVLDDGYGKSRKWSWKYPWRYMPEISFHIIFSSIFSSLAALLFFHLHLKLCFLPSPQNVSLPFHQESTQFFFLLHRVFSFSINIYHRGARMTYMPRFRAEIASLLVSIGATSALHDNLIY